MHSNTDSVTIFRDLGKYFHPFQGGVVPNVIAGGEKQNFSVSHKAHAYNQIILIAYEMYEGEMNMIASLEDTIKREVKADIDIVLPYPFADEATVTAMITQIGNTFGTPVNPAEVVKKNGDPNKSLGFYLFITIVSNYCYL